MNTYRAVLWAKVQLEGNKPLYIFNSHYPLSGNNETRFKCAELEMNKIREIAEGGAWVSVGDKNIIPTKDDNEQYNPQTVYDELTKHGKNRIQDGDNHHGPSATWIGYTYDPYKNPINEDSGEFTDSSKLDVIVSNLDAICSFHQPGAFDPDEFRLIPLTDALTEEHNKQRYFASDHALIGADFVIDNNH
jgi:endonuclease/exonuclease/phosphatase family metal-dependent hydrolase